MNFREDFFVTGSYRRYYAGYRSPVEVRMLSSSKTPMEWKYKKPKYEEEQGGMRRRMTGKRSQSRTVATTVGVVSPCRRRRRRRPCHRVRFSGPSNGGVVVVSGRQYPRLEGTSNVDSSHIRSSVPRRFLAISDAY